MKQYLNEVELESILQADSLEDLSASAIFDLFRKEKQLHAYLPDAVYQVDPRDGALITYNTARARRPHDNAVETREITVPPEKPCPICQGRTTGVIDVAPLGEGFTFINKNLFPILYPETEVPATWKKEERMTQGGDAYGLHLLQWTSSYHDKDWQNIPLADRVVVMERLAVLEQKLLLGSDGLMPIAEPRNGDKEARGFVSIIKNFGSLVGGSLAHGHQQIAFSNIMPRKFHNNLIFFQQHGTYFTEFLQRENSAELLVKDYGEAVLLVPYFMRRPYDMLLVLKDVKKQYLYELTPAEVVAIAEGWHDAIGAILDIMPLIGKEPAYNVTVNNGPGAGLYVEFLPYTQETGGFEKLGLWVCQNNPHNVAAQLRETIRSSRASENSRS
jgi:galactose-1-phosphate uridylyltransferase